MTEDNQTHEISNAAQKMCDGALEMKSAVVERGRDAIQSVCVGAESSIKAKPYQSMLIALGVGVALGALLCRR